MIDAKPIEMFTNSHLASSILKMESVCGIDITPPSMIKLGDTLLLPFPFICMVLLPTQLNIGLVVVFLVISAAPYVINSIEEPNEAQKVLITNLKELPMTTPTSQTPKLQSQQQPAPPPKPTPPPSRVIREHVEPTSKK